MQKRYLLIAGLVIAFALVISYFVWGNINKANGSLAGQSKALVGIGNGNGNRDFIPPSVLEVASHAGNSTIFVSDERGARDFSSRAGLSAAFVSESRGARDFSLPSLILVTGGR